MDIGLDDGFIGHWMMIYSSFPIPRDLVSKLKIIHDFLKFLKETACANRQAKGFAVPSTVVYSTRVYHSHNVSLVSTRKALQDAN